MCCFARAVSFVGGTHIFARLSGAGTQFLVYQMEYKSEEPNAMILPLPVKLPPQEDSIRFIDLSDYEDFFEDFAKTFPFRGGGFACAAPPSAKSLAVHEVGNFVASFVPTMDDFDRLDKQFVIPKTTWEKIPIYKDYGFAVFQLRELSGTPHPMAFEFKTRSDEIFFPTVHIHDGNVYPRERFDHTLYLQHAGFDSVVGKYTSFPDNTTGFVRSEFAAKQVCNLEKAQGIIAPDLLIHRVDLAGSQENKDMIYAAKGSPTVPSFNVNQWVKYWPWTVLAAAFAWLFYRRNRLRQLKRKKSDSETDSVTDENLGWFDFL